MVLLLLLFRLEAFVRGLYIERDMRSVAGFLGVDMAEVGCREGRAALWNSAPCTERVMSGVGRGRERRCTAPVCLPADPADVMELFSELR